MEDSHCRDLSRKLKTAFELKRRWLRELEAEVNSLFENNETKKVPLKRCKSENGDQKELKFENINGIMCLRHKLDKVASKLKAIHTEGSQEHIHLNTVHEDLLTIHKTRETTTLNTSLDFQHLAHLVTELQSDHEFNCRLKEEIENKINEAYRKVAKQQVMLGRQCSESSNPIDKENANHLIDDFVRQHINPQKLPLQNCKENVHPQNLHFQESKQYVHPQNMSVQNISHKKLPLRDKN